MNSRKTTAQIIRSHTLTYFNLLNLILAGLVVVSGQYKNMLFMGVVIANTLIGIIQELKVRQIIDGLRILTDSTIHLVTESGTEDINAADVQVGDTIFLQAGDQLLVDCELLTTEGIELNESMLTGESRPVRKRIGTTLYSGTYVTTGSGTAKVLCTGDDCYAATLVQKTRNKKRATSEIQNTIRRIIRLVSYAIVPVGILLFYIQHAQNDLSSSLVSTVAGVLGMIPEGLVLLTSLSFILGVGRLAKKKALVQEMESIEALARTTVLCVDKTGTITTGNLIVEDICPLNSYADESVENLMNAIAFAFDDDNATSIALKNHFTDTRPYEIIDRLPFDSSYKYSGVTFEDAGSFLLGATDFIINDLSIIRKAERYEKSGFRVLLLASVEKLTKNIDELKEIKPYALILLSDEVKKDAKDIFAYFHRKNVAVKILSGDHPATASTIGLQAGITSAMSYVDATELPDDIHSLRPFVQKYNVFGRVTPEKKQALIQALRANGEVVSMVGDGVNDILALKDADCGIAMANGSSAARHSAHIVLADSDFSSIKDIIKEGRTVIANIERVSALYLTKTLYSILLCLCFILLGKTYPFIPIQLTLIGGVAIGIPSFLLALEHNDEMSPGSFHKRILRISFPAAIIMTALLLSMQFLAGPLALSTSALHTVNLYIGGAVSLGVLTFVCRPFNQKRVALCIAMLVLFVLATILMPDLLALK